MESSVYNEVDVNSPVKGFKGSLQTFKRLFLVEKLYNRTGLVILIFFAIIIALLTAFAGPAYGVILILAIAALPLLYSIIAYPNFGILVLVIMSFMLPVLGQLGVDGPVGTIMDGLQVLLAIGVLVKIKAKKNWSYFKGPITTVVLIWAGYNLLEFGNPSATSRLAWVYTVRPIAIITLSYFVFMYNIQSVKYIKTLFKVWLLLSIVGAAYAFKQEYIGFNSHEMNFLNTPGVANLLFIDGHWRKFSIFSDPVAFAYNMVMPSIFCICLFILPLQRWKKVVLALLIVFFLDAMVFSGTRGANVLLPAALVLFAILRYNRKVLVFCSLAAILLVILINVPTSNVNLYRFQSAFQPSTDPSYILRKQNQKRIQPYILSHPMGGGLGATGVWGKRFSPGTLLANFPPDSGYIRVAVEEGWLGLLIFCTFMFVIMRTGIRNYYLIENQELKIYCLAVTLIIFAYNLANFPQEALVQYPSNILFYLWVALINITLKLDTKLKEERAEALKLSI